MGNQKVGVKYFHKQVCYDTDRDSRKVQIMQSNLIIKGCQLCQTLLSVNHEKVLWKCTKFYWKKLLLSSSEQVTFGFKLDFRMGPKASTQWFSNLSSPAPTF